MGTALEEHIDSEHQGNNNNNKHETLYLFSSKALFLDSFMIYSID